MTAQTAAASSPVSPEAVAAYLRENPLFLAERPELYRALAPPVRVHGEALTDHMAAMLRVERARSAAMAERADDVLAAGRAAAGLAARVQEAVLALIAAETPTDCITGEFPVLLAVDAAALCVEAILPGTRAIPGGTVDRLLGGRAVVYRSDGSEARLLHGEAAPLAQHDALVLVPGQPPALLALSARERWTLDPSQGAGALTFLGRAVAAALRR
ncbi:conserved protein of unknown function [Rhodovastum atsumiense]|uniref:DUF484 family protein n=1 Tax=Rhodovastum atsumiense TaxID=504468 RepID=UPI00139F2CB9|nr:DUF484 family protein [Rhodovastum atsumiense]CAH2600475.1 conserved protein of unknown function [Rhodovastum atsumiense]